MSYARERDRVNKTYELKIKEAGVIDQGKTKQLADKIGVQVVKRGEGILEESQEDYQISSLLLGSGEEIWAGDSYYSLSHDLRPIVSVTIEVATPNDGSYRLPGISKFKDFVPEYMPGEYRIGDFIFLDDKWQLIQGEVWPSKQAWRDQIYKKGATK